MSILSRVVDSHEKRLDEHGKRISQLIDSDIIQEHGKRLNEHGNRLAAIEDLPSRMQALVHEFAKLREDITAPIGRLTLDVRALMRMIQPADEAAKAPRRPQPHGEDA